MARTRVRRASPRQYTGPRSGSRFGPDGARRTVTSTSGGTHEVPPGSCSRGCRWVRIRPVPDGSREGLDGTNGGSDGEGRREPPDLPPTDRGHRTCIRPTRTTSPTARQRRTGPPSGSRSVVPGECPTDGRPDCWTARGPPRPPRSHASPPCAAARRWLLELPPIRVLRSASGGTGGDAIARQRNRPPGLHRRDDRPRPRAARRRPRWSRRRGRRSTPGSRPGPCSRARRAGCSCGCCTASSGRCASSASRAAAPSRSTCRSSAPRWCSAARPPAPGSRSSRPSSAARSRPSPGTGSSPTTRSW